MIGALYEIKLRLSLGGAQRDLPSCCVLFSTTAALSYSFDAPFS